MNITPYTVVDFVYISINDVLDFSLDIYSVCGSLSKSGFKLCQSAIGSISTLVYFSTSPRSADSSVLRDEQDYTCCWLHKGLQYAKTNWNGRVLSKWSLRVITNIVLQTWRIKLKQNWICNIHECKLDKNHVRWILKWKAGPDRKPV